MKGIWIHAVKEWNARQKGQKYRVPRKGTKEYDECKKIMEQIKKGQTGGFMLPLAMALLPSVLQGLS